MEKSFADPLPFKIPLRGSEFVEQFPDIFQLGRTSYGYELDSWLDYKTAGSSEMAVVSVDAKFLVVICNAIPGVILFRDEKDESSKRYLRPDVTLYFNGALCCKIEEKASATDLTTAVEELTSKFNTAANHLFPLGHTRIWAIASAKDLISTFFLSFDPIDGKYRSYPHCSYNLTDVRGRALFIVDVMKFLRYLRSVSGPNKRFHLIPNVRRKTTNGHHVTWTDGGLVKEFSNAVSLEQLDRIALVYSLELPHVEWGEVNDREERRITVKRIGQTLRQAIVDKVVTRENALFQVETAVAELHNIGLAHCDISVNNIFVELGTNVVFLDDLEYLTPVDQPPPHLTRISVDREPPKNAAELDHFQLKTFKLSLLTL
eukprot:gene16579-22635_t